MATSTPATRYVRIGGFNVWWDGRDAIFLQSSSHDSELPNGSMAIVFSSNPRSANFHPVNFNQSVAVLVAHGKPAPAPTEERPRYLELRPA